VPEFLVQIDRADDDGHFLETHTFGITAEDRVAAAHSALDQLAEEHGGTYTGMRIYPAGSTQPAARRK
jgi:hypothetical protein